MVRVPDGEDEMSDQSTETLGALSSAWAMLGRTTSRGTETQPTFESREICNVGLDCAVEATSERDVSGYTDLHELWAAVGPNVVSVPTLEGHHVEPTVTALKSGADVLCEKSIADTADPGPKMVVAAKRTRRTLAVDYNYRPMPSFAFLRDRLDRGPLGGVRLASVDAHTSGRQHVLNLLSFPFAKPVAIRPHFNYDSTVNPAAYRLDDLLYDPSHTVLATVEFQDGPLASVSASIYTCLEIVLIDLALYGERVACG